MLVGDTDPLATKPNNLQSFLAKATSIDLKEKTGRFKFDPHRPGFDSTSDNRQWDTTSANGLVLIMEIAQLDAKTSRRIVKLIQDEL